MNPEWVYCRQCGAQPHDTCRGPLGKPVMPHPSRSTDANRLAEELELEEATS